MNKKRKPCVRCEIMGRKPKPGIHDYTFAGVKGKLCDLCYKEVLKEDRLYLLVLDEIEEDKRAS
jgi:hypothetical protein